MPDNENGDNKNPVRNGTNNDQKDKNQSRDLEVILSWTVSTIGVITLLALVFLIFLFSKGKIPFALGTYLLIASALFVSGCILGFLFGIPKIDKTSTATATTPSTSNSRLNFSDNANLEEISDWLTKIIVGLTLVQFNNIQEMLHQGAISINRTLGMANYDFYVFGYATIIFYTAAGFLISYFWTRTNYVYILEKGKDEIRKIAELKRENINLKTQTENLKTEKEDLENENIDLASVNEKLKESVQKEGSFRLISESENADFKPPPELEKIIEGIISKHPVTVPDDPQKNRWGGKAEDNFRKLEAIVSDNSQYRSIFDITLIVRSTDEVNKPLDSTVVFLLHDSFGKDVVYSKPENNKAEISLLAYEAFTVGVICDDGKTLLELDLNKLAGNPPGFDYEDYKSPS